VSSTLLRATRLFLLQRQTVFDRPIFNSISCFQTYWEPNGILCFIFFYCSFVTLFVSDILYYRFYPDLLLMYKNMYCGETCAVRVLCVMSTLKSIPRESNTYRDKATDAGSWLFISLF
jgi:hypothetical protein